MDKSLIAEHEKIELSPEEKKLVVDSLEKKQATSDSINTALTKKNTDFEQDWEKQNYETHKLRFEKGYYDLWKANEKQQYEEALKNVTDFKIEGALGGKFEQQLQPGDRFFWKTRNSEAKKIAKYKRENNNPPRVKFDKNTVREMSALDKYQEYHVDYFQSRNHQEEYYRKYVTKGAEFGAKWQNNIKAQSQRFGTFFGTAKGALDTIKDSVLGAAGIYGKEAMEKKYSRKNELDEGLRPFFSMTKKILLWKKQVGLLGTETQEERDDGSKYNKRILKTYTTGKPEDRVKVMDELAKKLLNFKLTPNMFTNKYMAKNMLQMQRYTDMLKGFVELTKYNPDYLDTRNKDAVHTSPEMAALVRSRIILMQPIMSRFMEKHAKYFGYRKDKKLEGANMIDAKPSDFENDDQYKEFIQQTWEMVKAAYNSTTDFMDEMADERLAEVLSRREQQAIDNREKRNKDRKDTELDDSKFQIKYDSDGSLAAKLLDLKKKITTNPYVYELYGPDLEKLFGKINEMTRRLDEIKARTDLLPAIREYRQSGSSNFDIKTIDGFENMWSAYVAKEEARVEAENTILQSQIKSYEEAINYLVDQKLDDSKFKLTEPSEEVKNVLTFESMGHVFEIEKAFKYNDILYKHLKYYKFDKYENFKDEKGKVVEIKDLWSQYNFTLLKRGLERARTVNKMKDGKTQVEINDPTKLNNIQRREICRKKYNEYAARKNEFKLTPKELVKTNIEELIARYKLNEDIDITKDESYERYFEMKSIAVMANDLHLDPTGGKIDGFKELRDIDMDEFKIRLQLFSDYFKRWEGQMAYTKSEAYAYIGDAADMLGNNAIIEGIREKYGNLRLNAITQELSDEWDNDKLDENTKNMIGELSWFVWGMATVSDYKVKQIKEFNKDAYVAYKAKFLAEKLRKQVTTTYEIDFEEMVEKGLVKNSPDEKAKYLARIDTAITLKDKCDKFFSNYRKGNKELHIDPRWSDKEKSNYLSANYHKMVDLVKKFDKKYCSEEYIIENMTQVLEDVKFCTEFCELAKADGTNNWEIIQGIEGHGIKDGEDMFRFEQISITLSDYVASILADYGIADVTASAYIGTRQDSKRSLLLRDSKYTDELMAAKIEGQIALKEEVKAGAKANELEEKIKEVEKLRHEEEIKNQELMKKDGPYDKLSKEKQAEYEFFEPTGHRLTEEQKQEYAVKGNNIKGITVVLKRKNKYDALYKELLDKRINKSTEEENEFWDRFFKKNRLADKILDEEEKLGKDEKVDYISKTKNKLHGQLMEMIDYKPLVKYRNYSEELFNYINKNFADADLTDPAAVKNALEKAQKAWFFQLSAGAKREAWLRRLEYDKRSDSMSDYFLWKNSKENDEAILSIANDFGKYEFAKNNIGTIRKIMDTITEADACINDIQTPEFMDRLKETLELKGIDERQFMFLLRKHNVGTSGLANTKSDANKARQNKADVDKYLDIGNKYDFLKAVAKDVLACKDELKLEKLNEQYILENFEKCYFIANKMAAFQQLYYGEMTAFRVMENEGGSEAEIAAEVKKYFDKGHGEEYGLYYNTVMAVANKYGVSANGMLNFGLTPEQIEAVRTSQADSQKLKNTIDDNLNNANSRFGASIDSRYKAVSMKDKAMVIDGLLSTSFAGIEPEKELPRYLKKKFLGEEWLNSIKTFYSEYDKAYQGAWGFIKETQDYENDNSKVSFTKRAFDYPEAMFLMSKNDSDMANMHKTKYTDLATNFSNLFARDKTNVGRNLSVIDEDKCKRTIKRLSELGLIGSGSKNNANIKKNIISEEFFNKNFSADFFEDMINAENYCMMFEQNDDFLNLTDYKGQYFKAKQMSMEQNDAMKLRWESLGDAQKKLNMLKSEKKTIEDYIIPVKLQIEQNRKDGESEDNLEAQKTYITSLKQQARAKDKEIADCRKEIDHHWSIIHKAKDAYSPFIKYYSDEKLATLEELSKVFSDKRNRFMISHYVDLFISYLAKNGVKADGGFVNSDIYDTILRHRMVYRENNVKAGYSISKPEALEVGDEATKDLTVKMEESFAAKTQYITSGKYLNDYKDMIKAKKK